MRRLLAALTAISLLGVAIPASADLFDRATTPAGSVIARKSGEEVLFIDLPTWRGIDINQDLLPGDILRTNASGHLAVLFADNTQIRLARNTTLLVKRIGAAEDTLLGLEAGAIWARAERGGEGLTVETPAAAAAIRGTDWSMTVDGSGKTSLIVMEGLVELSNAFGSVSVAGGEGAVASIGQAPTKVVIVDPDDREQMLFYLTLRNSFGWMPASPLSSPDMRSERARISGIAVEARSADDWLTLAEVSLSYDGKQVALDAAEQARRFRLSAAQQARLDLVDALAAGAAQDYPEAARLFGRAAPRLDARRRAIALYGGYFARALADPDRVEKPPVVHGGGPYAALAEAWTAGFLKDIPAAIEVVRRAEQRYPDDPSLPAYRAQLALLIDDREQVEEAIARAFAIDPDDPTALEARANYKAGIESDLEGAVADLTRATSIAPGSTTIWNALGNVQSSRGAEREAEAAFRRSIELDPHDPVAYANLAIHYLDQDRVGEAKVLIDKALAVDPSFDIGLVARGRYHLQTGELDKAMKDLLAGSTANPAYSQALLLLAAGYYESGDLDPAEQALENADRLDPNDPVTSSFETAIAIDDYDSDRAIQSAQETLRRARARGGDYASISANRDAGSLLNEAFRLQGLDAWGRYYGDVVFDPFSGAGYVDQALAGSVDPFAVDLGRGGLLTDPELNNSASSALFQGLMFDPLMLSGRSRTANLLRRPFVEGSAGGGFVRNGENWGWTAEGELQGYAQSPIPWSFYGKFEAGQSDDFRSDTMAGVPVPTEQFNLQLENISGTGYITAKPTPNDRVVAYFDIRRIEPDLLDGIFVQVPPVPFTLGELTGFGPVDGMSLASTYDRRVDDRAATGALGWSHTLGYRNVLNAAFFASGFKRDADEDAVVIFDNALVGLLAGEQRFETRTDQQSYLGAVNHTYGIDDLTIRYGLEAGALDFSTSVFATSAVISLPIPLEPVFESTELDLTLGRAYFDALYEVTPDLKIEAAAFGTLMEGGPVSVNRFEPRIGAAWAPFDGHWLRAGFLRETAQFAPGTLSPIGVVGLQSNQLPLALDGHSDTFIARWDAEWNSHLFTSVDYQQQELNNISIPIPGLIDTIPFTEGSLERVSATANIWLEHGFGAFGTIAYLNSENQTPGFDGPLPFIPEITGRVGLTWVNPANLKVTLAATYVGERDGDLAGTELDDYWTGDAFLIWEPFDKRFELELAAYNILDQEFDVARTIPGWGRSFVGSLKVRF